MKIDRRFFVESLVARLGIALGTIVVLALAATISATVFTELSTGKAAAINIAGSLRMQSYLIASTVANPYLGGENNKRRALERNLAEFERRLDSPLLLAGLPRDERSALREAYHRVNALWQDGIKPGARDIMANPAKEPVFLQTIPAFVTQIDRLVTPLEQDLEGKIQALRLYQGIALFLIVFVIFAAMYLMHTQVLVPLTDLLGASRAVRGGNFSVRAAHTGADELGQLGEAFNYMVRDLSQMYANLEARVAEKTRELERTNRSLELLYNTTRTLSGQTLTSVTLAGVLHDVERAIGVPAGVICAHDAGQTQGLPLAATALDASGRPALCHDTRCEHCFADGTLHERQRGAGGSVVSVPLAESGRTYGVMALAVAAGQRLEQWQLQLAEAVGHHIGAALATARRVE